MLGGKWSTASWMVGNTMGVLNISRMSERSSTLYVGTEQQAK